MHFIFPPCVKLQCFLVKEMQLPGGRVGCEGRKQSYGRTGGPESSIHIKFSRPIKCLAVPGPAQLLFLPPRDLT